MSDFQGYLLACPRAAVNAGGRPDTLHTCPVLSSMWLPCDWGDCLEARTEGI